MMQPIGRNHWVIAEGYISGCSTGPEPRMMSHETTRLLNISDQEAHVQVTIFFSGHEPLRATPTTPV